MTDKRTMTLGELPDFPKFSDDYKTPGFQSAQSGYGSLRGVMKSHRDEIARIDSNLEIGDMAKRRLKTRAAAKASEKLEKIKRDYGSRARAAAILAEAELLSGSTVVERVPSWQQREVRDWLLGLSPPERSKAITDAMHADDPQVLVSALCGPSAFNLLPTSDMRRHVARQLDPGQARLADALADAVKHLRVGETIVAAEIAKSRDPEAARADEIAAAQARTLAERAKGTPPAAA